MRTVSLLPSATEIVCALGARDELVGVSHECDHPPGVSALPSVTRAKLRVDGTSAAIDADVRRLVALGLGVYEIDVERLRALAPDVIVTQDQCDVCAVPYAAVEAATRAALGSAATIVSLMPVSLADVWQDVTRVADALGRQREGADLLATLHGRLATLAAAVAGRPRPVVACIEWLDPLMIAGNWMPELVAAAGGAYPFAPPGAPSRVIEWDAIAAAEPEVVALIPCGFTLAQTERELPAWTAQREWRTLAAVRAGRAAVVDGNAYCNRPGPRLVESAEILAALLHPDAGICIPPDAVRALA
jgi:iron complex transport system substrate-binding protein